MTPRDQVLCDLVYLFNNVLRCYAPAVGHAIEHQPSAVVVDQTQFALAQAGGSVPAGLQQPIASQVSWQSLPCLGLKCI